LNVSSPWLIDNPDPKREIAPVRPPRETRVATGTARLADHLPCPIPVIAVTCRGSMFATRTARGGTKLKLGESISQDERGERDQAGV
jgi:hypothetical protein